MSRVGQQTRAVLIDRFGGPEVLRLADVDVGSPGEGEIRVRHEACGLNFIDVYHRSGAYPLPLPHALGMEAAGVVEAVGEGVSHLAEGDRVAYAAQPPGAYADARVMPAAQVCRLPDAISFEEGAALMLQGMTVEYLFHRTVPLKAGDTVLFHAAAGGVGLLACQWARDEGIRLIGTAGSDEKCALALAHGASEMINYSREDFVGRVRDLTEGRGVDAVMDSVGRDTFEGSLDCLRPVGMFISFGAASGAPPAIELGMLAAKGSLQVTRPTLFTHIARHTICQAVAAHVFSKVERGALRVRIGQRYPLAAVAEAHRDLEARRTTGSTILIP